MTDERKSVHDLPLLSFVVAQAAGVVPPSPVPSEPDECPCCLGDPDLVCDACGDHACWAGRYMCQYSLTAGVVHRDEYVVGGGKGGF